MAYSRTFYGTGYYIYHQFVEGAKLSRAITSWDGNTPPDADVLDLLRRTGSDLAPAGTDGIREQSGRIQLAADGVGSVWADAHGPSMLRALEFSVPRDQAVAFSKARLRVTWDGRPSASIDTPIALFFGAGILYNRDARLAEPLMSLLRDEGDLVVGRNQPYAASELSDFALVQHGEKRGVPCVEIEMRQDLIAGPEGQSAWAERLARLLPIAARGLRADELVQPHPPQPGPTTPCKP